MCLLHVSSERERPLTVVRLFPHRPLQVGRNWCSLLVADPRPRVYVDPMSAVEQYPCRHNSSGLVLPVGTQGRHDQVRESLSCLLFCELQNLTPLRLVLHDCQHLLAECNQRAVVPPPDLFGACLLFLVIQGVRLLRQTPLLLAVVQCRQSRQTGPWTYPHPFGKGPRVDFRILCRAEQKAKIPEINWHIFPVSRFPLQVHTVRLQSFDGRLFEFSDALRWEGGIAQLDQLPASSATSVEPCLSAYSMNMEETAFHCAVSGYCLCRTAHLPGEAKL